jgi:hypothetical protein
MLDKVSGIERESDFPIYPVADHEEDPDMHLTAADSTFISRRSSLVKYWPVAGSLLLLMLIGLGVWLWIDVPWLINPREVMHALEAGKLADSTLTLMAMMLPFVMLACIVFSVLFVLLAWRGFKNERRLLDIIDRLQS